MKKSWGLFVEDGVLGDQSFLDLGIGPARENVLEDVRSEGTRRNLLFFFRNDQFWSQHLRMDLHRPR